MEEQSQVPQASGPQDRLSSTASLFFQQLLRHRRIMLISVFLILSIFLFLLTIKLAADSGTTNISMTKESALAGYGRLPLAFEANAGQTDSSAHFLAHTPGGRLYFGSSEVVLVRQAGNASTQADTLDEHVEVGGKSSQISRNKDRGIKGSLASSHNPASATNTPTATPTSPGTTGSSADIANAAHAANEVSVVHMRFVNATSTPQIDGRTILPGKVNYFLGSDPSKWRTNIPTYRGISYSNLYPGIDIGYEGVGGELKGTYRLAAGADPSIIKWRYEGVDKVWVDQGGNLQIRVKGNHPNGDKDKKAKSESSEEVDTASAFTITEQSPIAWQDVEGRRTPVSVLYELAPDDTISFRLGNYDRTHPLTIDPTIIYSTFLGGSNGEEAYGVAADGSGNAYITGWTSSTDFPTVTPTLTPGSGIDVFITKINSGGTSLVYSTYFGGSGTDVAQDIAVDPAGNAYITGRTGSLNFPTPNAVQPSYGGGFDDAFVAKINPAGSGLIYSTYLGGTDTDEGNGIAADSSGNAYITGRTRSSAFPTATPYQPSRRGTQDAFVTKLNSTGQWVFSTYLGGDPSSLDIDEGKGIAADSAGNAYIAGRTESLSFPTANPYQGTNAGSTDAFITKMNPSGSALLYSTYLGDTGDDNGAAIAVDSSGNAYITGYTNSGNFPVSPDAFQTTNHGDYDAFVSKLNPNLPPTQQLVYSTYLGGEGDEFGHQVEPHKGIAVDGSNYAYVAGRTSSTAFPTRNPVQPSNRGGAFDAFVTKLNQTGTDLVFSTYLGGTGRDIGDDISVDTTGNAYVVGFTGSTDFPTPNAIFPNLNGGGDGFIAKICPSCSAATSTPTATPTATPNCPPPNLPTNQLDDRFTKELSTTCDVDTNLKIGRFYGPIESSGYISLTYWNVSIARYATLKVNVQDLRDDIITVSFANVTERLTPVPTPGRNVYNISIDSRWLKLPAKGLPNATPVPASNQLVITHQPGPSGFRATIDSVELRVPGMRPLVLAAGFNPSLTTPDHTQEPTGPTSAHPYWNDTVWDAPKPYDQFSTHPDRDGHDSIYGPVAIPTVSWPPTSTIGGGATMGQQVEQYKTMYGVRKVNILGHSQGGLWGREYVKNVDRYHSVDKLIMLGSPNEGSFVVDTVANAYVLCKSLLGSNCPRKITDEFERRSPALPQLTGAHMRWYNASNGKAPCVAYYDLAAEVQVDVAGVRLSIPPGTDEVLTTHSEQILTYSTHLPVVGRLWPGVQTTVHQLEPEEPIFRNRLGPIYSFPANNYKTDFCEGTPVPVQGETPSPTPTEPVRWMGPISTIQSGQIQTFTVPFDNAYTTTIGLNWGSPTSTLGLTLRDPLGRVITPTSTYTDTYYIRTLFGVQYTIGNPTPGNWQLVVSGDNVPDPTGEAFSLGGEHIGGVQLNPELSSSFVRLGQSVVLTSTLRDPSSIPGAVVTAGIVLLTGGNFSTLVPLAEQPGGIYRGVFTPTLAGTYHVIFVANGINNQGQNFARQGMLRFQASSGAALTGSFTEHAYPKNPGSGPPYESLVISATAAISEAGQYRLKGHLTSTDGREVASSIGVYTMTNPMPSNVELPLRFEGTDIGASAADGPYQLRDLYFSQMISDDLTMDFLPLAYTTTAYSRYDWPRQEVIQSGMATERGVDTNGNGLYDYLEVSIPIDVRTAGVYSASVNLTAPDGFTVSSAAIENLSLGQGAHTLIARFDGMQIRTRGVDGPYGVEDLLVWRPEDQTSSSIPIVLPRTQPYLSTDFEPVCSASGWCISPSPNQSSGPNVLNGVAVLNPNNIWVVGGYSTAGSGWHSLIEQWDGSVWHKTVPSGQDDVHMLHGVSAVDGNHIWAVGDIGILHYLNGTWSANTTSHPGGNGVSAWASNAVWTVGNSAQAIQYWNGSAWSKTNIPTPTGTPGTLNGVAVVSGDAAAPDVWAVGFTGSSPNRQPFIARLSCELGGCAWRAVSSPPISGNPDAFLTGVDKLDANHVWATGSYFDSQSSTYKTLTEFWDGTEWKIVPSPNVTGKDNQLNSVTFTKEGDVWAMGDSQDHNPPGPDAHPRTILLHWNDNQWQQVQDPNPGINNSLVAAATTRGASAVVTGTWAVGSYTPYQGAPSQTLVEYIKAPPAPPTTTTYYETSISPSIHHQQGCDAAGRHETGVIVLDYGSPRAFLPAPPIYGTLLLGTRSEAYIEDITKAVINFAAGYADTQCGRDPDNDTITIVIGTNNDNHDGQAALTVEHADAWADMVEEVYSYIEKNHLTGIDVAGGMNIQPDWSEHGPVHEWVKHYTERAISVCYNYGSTDGYPAVPQGQPTPVVPPPWEYSSWDVEQLFDVSWKMGGTRPLPLIFHPQDARGWYQVKRYSLNTYGAAMDFNIEMSECGATKCKDGQEVGQVFNPEQAWQVFWLELNADTDTAMRDEMERSTDAMCSNGSTEEGCKP